MKTERDKVIKAVLIMGIVGMICFVLATEILRFSGLSATNVRPFVYKGGTGAQIKSAWIEYMRPLAKAVGSEKGIPWEFIIAQTGLETGWGRSSLLQEHNNFGGIKAANGQPSVTLPTREEDASGNSYYINSKFRKWPTPYEGLLGYANFFHDNKRYAPALKYPKDPFQFAVEIKKAGYATATNYVATLHDLIKQVQAS